MQVSFGFDESSVSDRGELMSNVRISNLVYDHDEGILVIRFLDGGVLKYKVPPRVYSDMVGSKSFNKFYKQHIRDQYVPV